MRKIVITAAAILLLGAGSILALLYFQSAGRGSGPADGVEPGPQAAAGPAPASPLPPPPGPDLSRYALPGDGGPGILVPPKPMQYAPAPPRAPAGTWEAVPAVARPAALGRLGVALHGDLQELEPRLSACFDEVTQARHGRTGFTEVKEDYVALDDTGTTVLMLELETLQDRARIVDAPVETRGGASDGLIACAQQVLRGRTFPAPGAKPGSRHRVQYQLVQ